MNENQQRKIVEAVRDAVRKIDITPHLVDEPSLEELRDQAANVAGYATLQALRDTRHVGGG